MLIQYRCCDFSLSSLAALPPKKKVRFGGLAVQKKKARFGGLCPPRMNFLVLFGGIAAEQNKKSSTPHAVIKIREGVVFFFQGFQRGQVGIGEGRALGDVAELAAARKMMRGALGRVA